MSEFDLTTGDADKVTQYPQHSGKSIVAMDFFNLNGLREQAFKGGFGVPLLDQCEGEKEYRDTGNHDIPLARLLAQQSQCPFILRDGLLRFTL